MKIKLFFLISFLFIFLQGCALFTKRQEIVTLENLSKDRKQMDALVRRQRQGFYRLKEDIMNNSLEKGSSKNRIVSKYSEPVFCKFISDKPDVTESCLYREPMKYFNTDIVYLYFDSDKKLIYWEFNPAGE